MPAKKANTKLQGRFSRAKRKLKDIGVGVATAVATIAPIKASAQDRVIDAEATRISVVMDTIRLGMTVENKSSLDKEFMIFEGVDMMALLDDALQKHDINVDSSNSYSMVLGKSFEGTFHSKDFEKKVSNYSSDEKGLFFTLAKSAMYKNTIVDRLIERTDYTYAYNTDRLYDKYLKILGKQFSFARTLPTSNIKIVIHCLDEYVKISAYDRTKKKDKYGQYPLLGSMVVNARNENVAGFSYDHEVFVFRTNDDMQNYRVFDGNSEKVIPVNIVNKTAKPKVIKDYRVR